ncbi:MAG: CpXC domain-containing protein [Anaerolineaceae bacterium]|nr:CpXC domain-containing protein [Anaerolineaceae bacterium]
MPKTTVNCPRCRQPITADIQQLFDVNEDPQAKGRLLSGAVNMALCPHCGFEGPLSTPMVYHDPDKELLLTYFPPEMALPMNEQERIIGPFIKKVTDSLPMEKRKAYLLRPQTMLTFDSMIEKILAGDGITKEMIERQRSQIKLMERLLSTVSADSRAEIIHQEEALIDEQFFGLLAQVAQASVSQDDEKAMKQFGELQDQLLTLTSIGQKIKAQSDETQEAIKALQDAGKEGLTREKLLGLIVEANSDARLSAYVSMAHSGMDYEFFTLLTSRIEAAEDEDKEKLESLREKLLDMTNKIDEMLREQMEQGRQALETVIAEPNIEEGVMKNAAAINEFFFEALKSELEKARTEGDLERSAKLNQVSEILQKLTNPPEMEFIKILLSAESEEERIKILEENPQLVTPEMVQLMGSFAAQSDSDESQPDEIKKQIQDAFSTVLRYTMKNNIAQ